MCKYTNNHFSYFREFSLNFSFRKLLLRCIGIFNDTIRDPFFVRYWFFVFVPPPHNQFLLLAIMKDSTKNKLYH